MCDGEGAWCFWAIFLLVTQMHRVESVRVMRRERYRFDCLVFFFGDFQDCLLICLFVNEGAPCTGRHV